MKKYLASILVVILGLVLVSCKPRYEPIINADDFDKSWTFDSSIDTRITFAHTMGKTEDPKQGQQALLDQQIEAFVAEMKEDFGWNVSVRHSQYGGYTELLDKVSKELAEGIEPNMAYAYPDHVASYIASDKVLPLDNLINNNNKDIALSRSELNDYVSSFMNEGQLYDHSGTTLSVPFSKSTEVLFYNKTFFEKHNLEVPTTWDEVRTVGEQIKAIDKNMYPFAYDSDDNLFIVSTAQRGLPYTELDGELQGKAVFNTPGAVEMVGQLRQLHKDGILTTKGIIGSYSSDMFAAQELAMTVGSTGGTNHNVPANDAFEVGVAPMPQFDKKKPQTILQGPSIVIFRKGIRPDGGLDEDGNSVWVQPVPTQAEMNEMIASWMFYKFITRPENTIEQAMGTGYLPVRQSAFDTQAYKDYQEQEHADSKDKAKADVLALAQELMNKDAFFVSPAYPTSAKARKAAGELIMNALGRDTDIERLFRTAIANSD